MRFGRRKKNRSSTIRRAVLDRTTTALAEAPERFQDEGMATEERDALLNVESEDDVMASLAENEPIVSGDPTQRLLTALGRFQRQVSKAEQGGPQEAWCDECMNQIVTGIEVSIAEEWSNVQEALTDTARVLQTYENAGRASECVHFLQDSYEILCLMVGDLIVDNVRSGVMQKWHERYEAAIGDVAKAGLQLLSDDAPEDNASAPTSSVQEKAPQSDPALDEAKSLDTDFEDHTVKEPVAEEPEAEDFTALEPQQEEATVTGDLQEATSPFDSPEDSAEDSLDTTNLPSMDELIDMQARVTGQIEQPQDDVVDVHPVEEQEAAAIESFHDIDLRAPEEYTPSEKDVVLPFEQPPSLDSDAQTSEVSGPDPTAEVDVEDFYTDAEVDDIEVTDLKLDTSPPKEVPAIELIAETDAEPEVIEDVQELTKIEPIHTEPEAVEDLQKLTEIEPIEAEPKAIPEVPPSTEQQADTIEPGSPEALLQTARDAMARGDVADTKALALELAASMARLEADQAEAEVADAEQQLRTNEDAISAAEARVSDYEETLSQAEVCVVEHQALFQEKHEHVDEFQNQVEAAAESVSDLDAQLATLQVRRSEEAERLGQLESTLDEKLAEQSRAQSELDDMIAKEQSAQDSSDEARAQVAKLEEQQTGHKNNIRIMRAKSKHRHQSVDEIVDTIKHVTDTKYKPSDEGDMFF